MVQRLVRFALHQPLFTALLGLLVVGAGIAAFASLPIEAFPDVTDVQVQVITLFPGRAPEEIEKQVTIPLEIELSGLPHSVRMFSHTQFGLSYVIVTFDDKVDDYFARARVLERLQNVDLPPGVQPQLAPLSTPIGEIYRYSVKSDTLDATELRTYEDWVIERHLRRIPGVADVVPFGGFIKRYEVEVDQARLKSYDISLGQVVAALGRCNSNAGGSYIEQGEQEYLIRGIGLLKSADELNDVMVAERKSTPIFLKDVATIRMEALPRQGAAGKDDVDEAVTGIVLMRKGENPSLVLKEVKATIDRLNKSILPKTVRIEPYYDRTTLIETTLGTVFHNLLEGGVLVTIVLFAFLGNIRASLIVALIIPLSLLATFIGLSARGIPANLLSLGAMDFGIVVDGAVIVVENVFRHLSHKRPARGDKRRIREIVQEAAVEVGRPTLFSMLIIIIAYIPVFTLQRQEGRIFSPMAYTVVSALLGSLLFSLTLVPLLCYLLLRRPIHHEDNILVRLCKRAYEPVLRSALAHPWKVVCTAGVALLASFVLVPRLGTEFLPELNEGTLWLNVVLPPGISLSEAQEQAHKIRKIVHSDQFPEVTTAVSQVGRPEDGTDPKTLNSLEMFVGLKPQKDWRPQLKREELIDGMEKAVATLPGVFPSISQPIRDNVLESISAIKGQIVIKVFGEEIPVLREKAAEILQVVGGIRGVSRAAIDRQGSVPQLRIEIDRKAAARYGLNIGDVEDVIETALGGKQTTEIWEGEKKFGVFVRLAGEQRTRVDEIRRLLVDTPDGLRIPLEQVAQISVQDGSINISREASMRVVAISVFIQGRDLGSIVSEMQGKVNARVQMPAGYFATWGGEFENQERAMQRLAVIVPISIFLIFVLLFDGFKSVRDALLILINVPLALIGGIVALYVTGIPLSVSAAVGFIALFGQAVLNGVVMVSYFRQLREGGADPYEAVFDGGMVRLRTVMMTALLAMLGLLPMAMSKAAGAEVQKPLAVVVIGGLVSATVLTLVVLPTLYLIFERRSVAASAAIAAAPEARLALE